MPGKPKGPIGEANSFTCDPTGHGMQQNLMKKRGVSLAMWMAISQKDDRSR